MRGLAREVATPGRSPRCSWASRASWTPRPAVGIATARTAAPPSASSASRTLGRAQYVLGEPDGRGRRRWAPPPSRCRRLSRLPRSLRRRSLRSPRRSDRAIRVQATPPGSGRRSASSASCASWEAAAWASASSSAMMAASSASISGGALQPAPSAPASCRSNGDSLGRRRIRPSRVRRPRPLSARACARSQSRSSS